MAKITGKALVLISKHTSFDPANPEKTPAHSFAYVSTDNSNKDGSLKSFLSADGYVLVGHAEITVDLLPTKKVTEHAVASLRKQKEKVIADAQAAATSIERQIQSLLAIEHTA